MPETPLSTVDATANDASTRFLYGTRAGRMLLRLMLTTRIPALLGAVLRSPLSRCYIKPFIRKNGIDMTDFAGMRFSSFNAFFTRKKAIAFDSTPEHLIAPADSRLSVYNIAPDAKFRIKGFDYSLSDFFDAQRFGYSKDEEEALLQQFSGGLCLVFRLCATDYHRYCYIDSGTHAGKAGENHFIQGSLYSVQPLAAEHFRIYTKNRRSWTIMQTAHFAHVAQIEVGAFSVGGIVNHNGGGSSFCKGDEKGYFDLHGSTIVLLLQKGAAVLSERISSACKDGSEVRVRIGECIGSAKRA